MADRREWLEADGRGGFASGTVTGVRTRRYHAWLLAATAPPTARMVLVNGAETWLETPAGDFALTSQRYAPDVVHPDGAGRIAEFSADPWPRWLFRLEDGTMVEHELFVSRGRPAVALSWRLRDPRPGVRLAMRPLLSGRDYHALQRENPAFRFNAQIEPGRVRWRPYDIVPGVTAIANGAYEHAPEWYRNFLYEEELARGLDAIEDLASPGVFRWDLSAGEATLVFATEDAETPAFESLRATERARRAAMPDALDRAAESYRVRRGAGWSMIAGYPWFADWGRDAFLSLRGLCLATGREDVARAILIEWAGMLSEGMLPNRLPDVGAAPEYNSVDASLWFVIAVRDLCASRKPPAGEERRRLLATVAAILDGYAHGTRHGIRLDDDGLLAAGEPGVALTWMDARIDGRGVTPRIGKPVEVQALWLNALHFAGEFSDRWHEPLVRGRNSFLRRFWLERHGHLADVVDVDHVRGTMDDSFRPNQVLAVGGLPMALLYGARARRLVDAVEARLWTPLGLRSLAPGAPGYRGRYEGGPVERDGAYHQGTVWPWLAGPFVEAWVRVRGGGAAAKAEARTRFLAPLLAAQETAGLGHLPEIADGDPPHAPRGCPFQAWSLGEALRLSRIVLAEEG